MRRKEKDDFIEEIRGVIARLQTELRIAEDILGQLKNAQPTTEPEEEFEEDETWAIVFREKDTRAMVYGCPVCGESFMEKDTCPYCGAKRKETDD